MKHPIVLFFLMLAVVQSSLSQARLGTLEEALKLATLQNAGIQAAAISGELAKTDLHIAGGNLLPSVNLSASADYNYRMPVQLIPAVIFGGAEGEYREIQFGQPYVANMAIDVSMPLYAPDKWRARETARKMEIQAGLQTEKQAETVKMSVIQAWYQNLLFKAILDINAVQVTLADSLKSAADKKMANDILSPADYNRILNLVNTTRMAIESNRTRYIQSALTLKQLLHLPMEDPLQVEASLTMPEKSAITTDAAAAMQRPGYLAQAAGAATALSQMQEKQAARLPKLSLNARHTLQFQFDQPFSDDATSNNFDFGSVGLSFQVPLFRGKTLALQTEKAHLRHEQTLKESAQALEQSQKELLDWQLFREEAFANAPAAKANAERSTENVGIALKRYEEGLTDLTEYFNVYGEYVQAQQAYLQVLVNANVYQALLNMNQ
ncbi:MAG: TolC family protein [Saprospiraceae bacterium]|nr:TolC family protein [Saprospiraceae bacterium]